MGSFGNAAAAAQLEPGLTRAEIDWALGYLEKSRRHVVEITGGMTPEQWTFKPAPDCWSIAENLEHIVIILELVTGPIRQQLAQAPPPPNADQAHVDVVIVERVADPSLIRVKAPERAQPSGLWTPAEALERMNRAFGSLAEYLESTPDLRRHALPSPPVKVVSNGAYELADGYQWVMLAGGHTERHARQMEEVKTDPAFPIY